MFRNNIFVVCLQVKEERYNKNCVEESSRHGNLLNSTFWTFIFIFILSSFFASIFFCYFGLRICWGENIIFGRIVNVVSDLSIFHGRWMKTLETDFSRSILTTSKGKLNEISTQQFFIIFTLKILFLKLF